MAKVEREEEEKCGEESIKFEEEQGIEEITEMMEAESIGSRDDKPRQLLRPDFSSINRVGRMITVKLNSQTRSSIPSRKCVSNRSKRKYVFITHIILLMSSGLIPIPCLSVQCLLSHPLLCVCSSTDRYMASIQIQAFYIRYFSYTLILHHVLQRLSHTYLPLRSPS